MSSRSAEDEQRADNLKQVHDYIRHIFQMYLTWFTVFSGVNYAAMGWLVGFLTDKAHNRPAAAWVFSAAFVLQNILAVIVTYQVAKSLKRQSAEAARLSGSDRIVPQTLYRWSTILIGVALTITAIAWAINAYIL